MAVRALPAVIWLILAFASAVAGQPTIFVVRHAERADTEQPVPDPDLSSAGHARAQSLATVLQDAGITAVFVTPLKRTQQTAAPLAKTLGLTPVSLPANDTPALIARLRQHQGRVLVVGHSNTVPEIVKQLGAEPLVSVADTEFDHLFMVTVPSAGKPFVVHLRYK